MPLWPVVPLVTIGVLGYSLTQQSARDLLITGAVLLVGVAYWFGYLRPRGATHWMLSLPADLAGEHPAVVPAAPSASAADAARTALTEKM